VSLYEDIAQLEAELTAAREDWPVKTRELRELRDTRKSIEDALQQLRDQFQAVNYRFNQKNIEIQNAQAHGKELERKLNSLKREKQRQADSAEIRERMRREHSAFAEKCLEAPWRAENRSDGLGALPHQIEGAISLAVAKTALCGDKRGLGKTLTSIVWADLVEARRILCIGPSDTMDNYIRELQLWAPHRSPIKLGKLNQAERNLMLKILKSQDEFVIVMNYEAWRKDTTLVQSLIDLQADTVILDESHRAKTMKTSTYRGVRSIIHATNCCPNTSPDGTPCRSMIFTSVGSFELSCDVCGYVDKRKEFKSAKHVLSMTGTPILNKPQELVANLTLVDPEHFPPFAKSTERDFLLDFCTRDPHTGHWHWCYGGEKKVMEKIGPKYLARDRKMAGIIVPPSQPVEHLISFDEVLEKYPQQAGVYQQVRDYAQLMLDPSGDKAVAITEFVTVLLRLRQAITWPGGITLRWKEYLDPAGDAFIQREKKLEVYESIKIDKAEEIAREVIEEGERVVLFSQFSTTLTELHKRLGPRSVIYAGETNDTLRNRIQLDFDPKTVSDNPEWDIVLCNYKAAGEGLNLHAASQEIILDEAWNPGTRDQAHGRIDRMGQTRDTTVHTIRVSNTVDTFMRDLIEEKEQMIGGFDSLYAELRRRAYDALTKREM
jgi:SNF2 family DNA or RNA helicase